MHVDVKREGGWDRGASAYLTLVEWLHAHADDFQTWMRRDGELNVLVVGGGHPHGQTPVFD
jgi:hypothetical protein